MKKDFTRPVVLTVLFLAFAGVPLGPAVTACRAVVYYLIHPGAESLAQACRYSGYLGESWSRLLAARAYMDQEEVKNFAQRLESFEESTAQEELDFQDSLGRESEMAASGMDLPRRLIWPLRVVHRGLGQEEWASRICTEPIGLSSTSHLAVVQFIPRLETFVLAGRNATASDLSSRPCFDLVTSPRYALSVSVEGTGETGLLRGLGRPDRLSLEYLPKESKIKAGDRLKTSRLSAVAPAGILVGEVVEVEPAGAAQLFSRAYVRAYFDLARLDHLLALGPQEISQNK
ncbi:MAG: rod shape-determining protein MreC [Elusimicrobiota bacterium]